MITVTKNGTLGNNMWQYAVARIIAEKNNLKLNCFSIPGFHNTNNVVTGKIINSPTRQISGHRFDMNSIGSNTKIIMNGFFQRYEYIKEYKNEVKEWFKLDINTPFEVNKNDLVVSIRRGWNGYPVYYCPPQEYFIENLNKIDCDRIILCTDTFEDPFFKFLEKLNVEVIKANYSPLEQFSLIQKSNKIFLTSSTFCWWAAFLSNASEIYYPWINNFIPTENGVNWYVDDEYRYIILS